MTRIRRFLGAVLIAGSSTQCLLFAESPNVQPDVKMVGPSEVVKAKKADFMAEVIDDRDGRSAALKWFLREQTCPASLAEAEAERAAGTGATHTVIRAAEGAFCVGVVATDAQGASAFTAKRFDVRNQAPVAKVSIVTPTPLTSPTPGTVLVPLFSDLRLSGAGSQDDDEPSSWRYKWKVLSWPAGEASEPSPCATAVAGTVVPDGPEICRRLSVSGEYVFELTVSDGRAESTPLQFPVVAQTDALPCFRRTEPPHDLSRGGNEMQPPLVITPDSSYVFRVMEVYDDGDPYPAIGGGLARDGSFIWHWRPPGELHFRRSTDTTLTSFPFYANNYRPGDEIEVRVDYQDRQTNPCLETNADHCKSPPNSDCFQRVSWRLRFIK